MEAAFFASADINALFGTMFRSEKLRMMGGGNGSTDWRDFNW